jgi:Leucine-rich repeat (LRR) protein
MSIDPEPGPSEDPSIRRCDDGTYARPATQGEIEALRGCVSLFGLEVTGAFDLRPLESLRSLGAGGLLINGDTPLTGLENLEETSSLVIQSNEVLDLSALESLGHTNAVMLASVELTDLRGLEDVAGIRTLSIAQSPSLASLDGFIPPSQMEALSLVGTPALSDISALRYVTNFSDSLWIEQTAVERLPFDALTGISLYVTLQDNPLLADISALLNLEAIYYFVVSGSALRSAPAFEQLTFMDSFTLSGNPVLEASPSFPLITSISYLDVSSNPSLQALLGFSALEVAALVSISNNQQLTELDLGNLSESRQLFIFENLQMDGAALASAFASVASEQNRIPLSQQAALPIAPCPWTDDTICDADFCVAAEDPACGIPLE